MGKRKVEIFIDSFYLPEIPGTGIRDRHLIVGLNALTANELPAEYLGGYPCVYLEKGPTPDDAALILFYEEGFKKQTAIIREGNVYNNDWLSKITPKLFEAGKRLQEINKKHRMDRKVKGILRRDKQEEEIAMAYARRRWRI